MLTNGSVNKNNIKHYTSITKNDLLGCAAPDRIYFTIINKVVAAVRCK